MQKAAPKGGFLVGGPDGAGAFRLSISTLDNERKRGFEIGQRSAVAGQRNFARFKIKDSAGPSATAR